MELKEVCERTGLAERTIRYYMAEQLIDPIVGYTAGAEVVDFTQRDVEELIMVANLRKLYFTLDDIKVMKADPMRIPEIVTTYKTRLEEEAEDKDFILNVLNKIDLRFVYNIYQLAAHLQDISFQLPTPERDLSPPNFGRFDEEGKEEKQEAYDRFLLGQNQKIRVGRVIVSTIAAIEAITGIITFFFDFKFFSLIISIALAYALFAGITWVRYLFIAISALQVFILLNLLLFAGAVIPTILAFIAVLNIIYCFTAAMLLFKSEAVKEFLYSQKNG